MHPKTIGLIAHPGKPGVGELIKSLAAEFEQRSMSILLEKETAAVAGQKSENTIAQIGAKADLLVVAGGDGIVCAPGPATPATGGPISLAFTSVASAAVAADVLIGSAVMVEPTVDFARAVGVLRSPAVEDIGVEPAVTDFAGLGAGAPASVFLGGTGLNESRNFSAAT